MQTSTTSTVAYLKSEKSLAAATGSAASTRNQQFFLAKAARQICRLRRENAEMHELLQSVDDTLPVKAPESVSREGQFQELKAIHSALLNLTPPPILSASPATPNLPNVPWKILFAIGALIFLNMIGR